MSVDQYRFTNNKDKSVAFSTMFNHLGGSAYTITNFRTGTGTINVTVPLSTVNFHTASAFEQKTNFLINGVDVGSGRSPALIGADTTPGAGSITVPASATAFYVLMWGGGGGGGGGGYEPGAGEGGDGAAAGGSGACVGIYVPTAGVTVDTVVTTNVGAAGAAGNGGPSPAGQNGSDGGNGGNSTFIWGGVTYAANGGIGGDGGKGAPDNPLSNPNNVTVYGGAGGGSTPSTIATANATFNSTTAGITGSNQNGGDTGAGATDAVGFGKLDTGYTVIDLSAAAGFGAGGKGGNGDTSTDGGGANGGAGTSGAIYTWALFDDR